MDLPEVNRLITAASDAWAESRDEGHSNASLVAHAQHVQNEANVAIASYLTDNPDAKDEFVFFAGSGFIPNESEQDPVNLIG